MSERPALAYKVLTGADLATLEQEGVFTGSPADRADGYIHLSSADQLEGTLARHYAGQRDLHLVCVDLDALAETLHWEPARDGALFPHIYGDLPLSAAIAYGPLEREGDGTLKLPVAG